MSNKITLLVFLVCFINHALFSQVVGQDSLKIDSLMNVPEQKKLEKGDSIKSNAKHLSKKAKDVDNMPETLKDSIRQNAVAAKSDTLSLSDNNPKRGNPVVATLCSTFVPGLGQAYNKKYWKIPIIYSVFGTMYFLASVNNQKYKDFKYAYINYKTDLQPVWVTENVRESYLKNRMEFYKRNRNFNIIIAGVFYLLNILDANVDAHLMDFDVGMDLSLRIEPEFEFMNVDNSKYPNLGMKFVFAVNRK